MRRVLPYGPGACLVEVTDTDEALRLAAWARGADLGAVDVVAGAGTVLFDGLGADAVRTALPVVLPTLPGGAGPVVDVPVRFDGEDLPEVAHLWRCTSDEVVRRLVGIEFTAAFAGFAPGFAYLAGLPAEFAVPRRASPRPLVPAGSVALGGAWCGIYPRPSPGGWQIVGTTDAVLWDLDRPDPALLPPGRRVRFVEA